MILESGFGGPAMMAATCTRVTTSQRRVHRASLSYGHLHRARPLDAIDTPLIGMAPIRTPSIGRSLQAPVPMRSCLKLRLV